MYPHPGLPLTGAAGAVGAMIAPTMMSLYIAAGLILLLCLVLALRHRHTASRTF